MFSFSQISNTSNTVDGPKVTRITKKNKDATGTKIKRSKRKSLETTPQIVSNKVARTNQTINTTDNNTEVFDIGNIDKLNTIQLGDMNAQSDEEDFAPLNRKSKKSKGLWDSEDSEDEPHNSRKDKSKHNKDHTQLDDSGEQLKVLRWDSDTDSENGREVNVNGEKSKPILKMCVPESPQVNHETIDAEVEEEHGLENSGSLLNYENQIKSLHTTDINNEITDEINPVKCIKLSEDLFSTDLTTNNEITDKVNKNIFDTKTVEEKLPSSPDNLKITKIVYETESAEGILLTCPNKLIEKKIVYETESTKDEQSESSNNDKVKENENGVTKNLKQNESIESKKTPLNANLSNFEIKMKELEESTMKKYKGSFLDSIF